MIYGYARVSSKEQNLERQIKELKGAGVEERNILMDKQSGKDFNRKSYNLLVGTDTTAPLLREGDVLTVYSIDRLGRNYTEIMKQWQYITQEIKADIRVLDMPLLDTRNNGDSLDSRIALTISSFVILCTPPFLILSIFLGLSGAFFHFSYTPPGHPIKEKNRAFYNSSVPLCYLFSYLFTRL